jgi:hypothetical protein
MIYRELSKLLKIAYCPTPEINRGNSTGKGRTSSRFLFDSLILITFVMLQVTLCSENSWLGHWLSSSFVLVSISCLYYRASWGTRLCTVLISPTPALCRTSFTLLDLISLKTILCCVPVYLTKFPTQSHPPPAISYTAGSSFSLSFLHALPILCSQTPTFLFYFLLDR